MPAFPLLLAILTSAADINALSYDDAARIHDFALTGTVTSVLHGDRYVLDDGTDRTYVWDRFPRMALTPGDRLAAIGHTHVDSYRQEQTRMTNLTVIGHVDVPPPQCATVRAIATGQCDYENVVVTGFVADVFRDDIDDHWYYLTLKDANDATFVTVPTGTNPPVSPETINRRTVCIVGVVIPYHCGPRRFIGPHVESLGMEAVTVIDDEASDVPNLDAVNHLPSEDVVRRGPSSLEGTVRCVWGGRSLLLEGDNRDIHRVDLASCCHPPSAGARIRATGLPETDLYRLNLTKAGYVRLDAPPMPHDEPIPFIRDGNHPRITRQRRFHGRTCTFTGTVLSAPVPAYGSRALLEEDGIRITFDISAVPELDVQLECGARVQVTGCGLIEMANWRPDAPPPQHEELVLVARSPDDLVVIARPPWWTQGRLTAVIVTLAVVIVVIVVWNRILKRLAERRGRQLMHEELARNKANFKTAERTRLAVELHDALSQALTGIACQLDASDRARLKNPARLGEHLMLARRALSSCRTELRNCLWDLHNGTLEDADAATAVRRTVTPHADAAEIDIDFDIRRSQLTDSVFHEILCILRELVSNAVRHGKARHIAIKGSQIGRTMTFSVSDDGCGFDPDNRPGPSEGHFGILGMTERLERLGAELRIYSACGQGATFSFTMEVKP